MLAEIMGQVVKVMWCYPLLLLHVFCYKNWNFEIYCQALHVVL